MSSAWSRRAALGAVAIGSGCYAVALGCGSGNNVSSTIDYVAPDAGPSAIEALSFSVDPGLACADGKGICVAPSQVVSFGVEGISGTVVSLSLEGDYSDAALSSATVTLGTAAVMVTLESASETAGFSIVARVGSAASLQSVSLPVTVASSGTATIEASPTYGGLRPATEFYATDYLLSTCAEIAAGAVDGGSAAWTPGPNGVAIALPVTAGEHSAVQVRLGHYAFGCADIDPLVPSATDAVAVTIYDVPLALALTNLNATFSYAADGTTTSAWQAVGQAAVGRIEGAFFASGSDGPALLDAMRVAIVAPADQAQFDELRAAGDWDATATSWMASHTPSIASRTATWLGATATGSLGPLVMQIGNGTSAGTAPVEVASFGSLAWTSAGITQPAPFQWTADANDTIHLAGAIDLATTPLFAHEADLSAAGAVSGATDVPSALALGIDCTGFASALVGSGESYSTCSAGCTANLCQAGLTTAWNEVAVAATDGSDLVHTSLTASAPADVGDLAEPAYVQGAWVGTVSGAGVPASVAVDGGVAISGTLLATEPTAPTEPSP